MDSGLLQVGSELECSVTLFDHSKKATEEYTCTLAGKVASFDVYEGRQVVLVEGTAASRLGPVPLHGWYYVDDINRDENKPVHQLSLF